MPTLVRRSVRTVFAANSSVAGTTATKIGLSADLICAASASAWLWLNLSCIAGST